MSNNKYKKIGIFFPFIYVLGYLLVMLLTKGETFTAFRIGFFLFYSFITYFFIQYTEKLIQNYICISYKRERAVLIIGLVILAICLFYCFASHIDFEKPSTIDPEIICLLLYLISSCWIAVYLKAKKIDEKEENEENS